MEQKMKMLENLQDDFDFNYKTLKSQGGRFSWLRYFLHFITKYEDAGNFSWSTVSRVVPGPEWKQPGSCHKAEDVSAGANAERSGPAPEGVCVYSLSNYERSEQI